MQLFRRTSQCKREVIITVHLIFLIKSGPDLKSFCRTNCRCSKFYCIQNCIYLVTEFCYYRMRDNHNSDLIVVVQSDGFEVLKFPQIPQFQRAILSPWSKNTEQC